ncbi:MAG: hypothetical protein CMD15_02985 [Flavobacteriales bacterium]|nr:hypothetical protein [Flavobacteriales bacterium]|tara:strand:- start:14055 stop:14489 length:435 start_codon:yes stop_codon:yes gene_type:complete
MKLIFCIIFNILLLNTLQAQKYTEQYIREANSLGFTWWFQVNNDNYKEAYESLSIELKEKMTIEKWASQMSNLMEEFGEIQNRQVINTEFKSEIEGLDDGFYVIIEYEVNYTKTRNHIEYLLLRQNDKLKWKIIDFQYQFQQLE